MKIIIDGQEVESLEGSSVLDAALNANIYIPHLCKHPDLEAVGGCRLCSVEIEGEEEAVPACKTIVKEGMKVTIHGAKSDKTRNMAMELILATHPADCTGCPKYGKCELQSMYQYMGVGPQKWKQKSRTVANDESNPLISHLFTRCVRCGRCVRACRELRGAKVLDYQKSKGGIRIGTDNGVSLAEAGCKFCGACIEVCPTGSIMDALNIRKEDVPYSDMVVPCKGACPASINIPQYVRYIKQGEFQKAIAVIREKVPFPETLGSICNHVCESQCKRGELGEPVSICRLKRAAGAFDTKDWKRNEMKKEDTGKKAAIIGAGPAGLTTAYYLAKKGHQVTVFEANEKCGGQLRYGIPAYRLPDEMLDREMEEILSAGVELRTNTVVDTPKMLLDDGYDTVLISVGTHQGNKLSLEGNELPGVVLNTDFLKSARNKEQIQLGEQVVVLGGGNVAYDCARTAIRLGAKKVHVVCLENETQMTASEEEIKEGEEEGVVLHSAHSFLKIIGKEKAEGVEVAKVDKFYFDENKKAVIELVDGTEQILSADTVIFAVGQRPLGTDKMEVELIHQSYISVNQDMKTSLDGIYAAGDVVTGTRSVIEAIAAGRKCAQEMDRYLGGDGNIEENLVEPERPDDYIGRDENFTSLQRQGPQIMAPSERKLSFCMMEESFEADTAKEEANRCLQCDLRLNLSKPKLWNEYQERGQ